MKLTHMALDYFPEFKCLTQDCKYTCCYEWSITVNRPDYMKLKNLRSKDKKLQAAARALCKRVHKSSNPSVFAHFILRDDGYCPLITKDGMCSLQQGCGYHTLPTVCKVFPRIYNVAPNFYEQSCSTGCEAVSYLLLARPQGLRVITIDKPDQQRYMTDALIEQKLQEIPQLRYHREIQMLVIGILQNRKYSLQNRILLLGLVCQRLDKTKTAEDIPFFIKDSLSFLQHDAEMEEKLNQMKKNQRISVLTAISQIKQNDMRVGSRKKTTSDIFAQEVINTTLSNLELSETVLSNINENTTAIDVSVSINFEKYDRMIEHFETLEYSGYFFENLMVNLLYQLQFPIVWADTTLQAWKHYMDFCIQYNMFRVICVAYMMDRDNQHDLVRAVTAVSRMLLHNQGLRSILIEQFEKNESDTLSHMAYLIRC